MSTKYQSSSEVPLKDLISRLNQLSDAVVNDRERSEFTMRIPAECDRDADLVISEAAVRLQRQNEQIKNLTVKLGLISIAADEGNLEKVKELIPPSCADAVREMRAEAVAARPPLINLDSLADGNHSFSFKTKNNQKFREIKINIEILPNQLRNPEQEKV
tara:strand:- start:3055 stop:3534 length:480 start_codon:yes stop_codon:yes gene_type:complete